MAQRGQDYALEISSDDGTTWEKVGKVTNITLNRGKDTIETNNFDSPNDAESIAGMKNWGLSGAALFVHDDVGQLAIEDAYDSVDPYLFRLTPLDTISGIEFEGAGHVTDATLEFATNEVIEYSLDVEGTGVLTTTAVA